MYAGLYVQVASLEEAAEDGLLAMLTVNTCAHLLAIAHSEGCGRLLDGCHVFALQVPPRRISLISRLALFDLSPSSLRYRPRGLEVGPQAQVFPQL